MTHCTGVPGAGAPEDQPGLVDQELTDRLLARAEAQGVALIGPNALLLGQQRRPFRCSLRPPRLRGAFRRSRLRRRPRTRRR